MTGLQKKYLKLRPKLMKELALKNVNEVPKLEKIVVNVGFGEAARDAKLLEAVKEDLRLITGQKPSVRRAKLSVSAFHLRAGMPVGLTVTLRGAMAHGFLSRLIDVVFPRVRDFRGMSPNRFDGRGSYNFGFREQSVFPEVRLDKIRTQFGMNVTIVTTSETDEGALKLLSALNFPFAKG